MEKQTLSTAELIELRDNAKTVLDKLVTLQGIYASTSDGWMGPYHAWFGRDSAITTDFLCAAVEFGGDINLADTGRRALLALARWQGQKNNEATGEEDGKLPHEIRKHFTEVQELQHAPNTNQKPWFIDPVDGILKNWDSVDATALWLIATVRAHRKLSMPYKGETRLQMKKAYEWLLRNMSHYEGFVGFLGADLQDGRRYSGLHNQGWKDTYQVYQDDQGLAKHPIKDVLVNAEAWAALQFGLEEFRDEDPELARRLRMAAETLRKLFNDPEKGFLLKDETYFAQAIDGRGKQLPQLSADVGMCLWAFCQDDCVIDYPYVDRIVEKITQPELFNPVAGVRSYALGTEFHYGSTRYHGSPYTYWPFVSGLVARGLLHFGYDDQAAKIMTAYLLAVKHFQSNIEMFAETSDHRLVPWHHPELEQQSAIQQAWTSAAVYYASLYLLDTSRKNLRSRQRA